MSLEGNQLQSGLLSQKIFLLYLGINEIKKIQINDTLICLKLSVGNSFETLPPSFPNSFNVFYIHCFSKS